MPDDDELAALVVIFAAALAGSPAAEAAGGGQLLARWRDPDQAPRFEHPRTWQARSTERGGQPTRQHSAVDRPASSLAVRRTL